MEFSAGGIVFRKHSDRVEFALILNSYDQWTFPKGHIEKGEKPEEAAVREIGEEIGLYDLKVLNLIDKIEYWFKLDGELLHKYVYFFLIEAPTASVLKAQDGEIADAQWFSPAQALEKLFYKDDPKLLKKAQKIIF